MAEDNQRISDGNVSSMNDLIRMMFPGRKDEHYGELLKAAKEMMLQYEAYKEAGFNDEQAFRVVLTILNSVISSQTIVRK